MPGPNEKRLSAAAPTLNHALAAMAADMRFSLGDMYHMGRRA